MRRTVRVQHSARLQARAVRRRVDDCTRRGGIYKRADLIVSILEPSKTIALDFEQNLIETKSGEIFTGAPRQETAEAFTLAGVDGQPHVGKKPAVATRKAIEHSLMPPGPYPRVDAGEFTGLLAFREKAGSESGPADRY